MDLSVLERSILLLQQGGPTGGREGSSLDFGASNPEESEGEVVLGTDKSR